MATHETYPGFFITASDTAAGKTYVACQIIRQIKPLLANLKVRKPVESGCTLSNGQLIPADGHRLYHSNDQRETLDTVTPYRFQAAIAPDQAARSENQTITLRQLEDAVFNHVEVEDFLVVEGAGGFYSPIAEDGLNADLAKRLGLDVIIVIEDRLGAINQALLTVRAIENEGLKIKALILNRQSAAAQPSDNLNEIRRRIAYPIHICPYAQAADNFQLLG